MIQDYIPHYYASPSLVHALIPEECRNAHSLLRWWQSVDPKLGIDNVKKSPAWTVDNIAIEYSHYQMLEIYDNFRYEYHIKSMNNVTTLVLITGMDPLIGLSGIFIQTDSFQIISAAYPTRKVL